MTLSNNDDVNPEVIARAEGCMLGQLAGDSLGSLVEFQSPSQILRQYPSGVRELADGGTFNTIAGQPTDDSEMALMLARALAERGRFDAVDSVMRGGDTDTNTALCGALLGAVHGIEAIPMQRREAVLN